MAFKLIESDLAQEVINWLEKDGWVTYKEVSVRYGVIDIVAIKDNIYWAIETKTKYCSSVLAQAHHHLHYFHKVSVAVPEIRASDRDGRIVFDYFAKGNGIGTIKVYYNRYGSVNSVYEGLKPKFNDNAKSDNLKSCLFDEQKQSVAGSQAGGCITSYKLTVMRIKEYLQQIGEATIADIVKNIKHHYRSDASARNSLSQYLVRFDNEIKVKYENNKTVYYLWKTDENI